jgi:hypothetical protein
VAWVDFAILAAMEETYKKLCFSDVAQEHVGHAPGSVSLRLGGCSAHPV